jgi:hypothetical protein
MRKLTLKKESLAELTGDELGAVVGGDSFATKFQTACICATRFPCIQTVEGC